MSRRKCALLSLVVILVGTLALASPDGPYDRLTHDPSRAPDENASSRDALTPLLQKLVGLLPQIEIEIDTGSKTECTACRDAKMPQAPDTFPLQMTLDEMFPDSHLQVIATANNSVAVVGQVDCGQDIGPIMELAEKFHRNVTYHVQVNGAQQVQLRLLIAEVTPGKLEGVRVNFEQGSSVAFGKVENASELPGFLRALKQEGHARIIAEPTLVTVTGRPATIIVGGEFPIQFPDNHGKLVTEIREFGTRIECLPIVLGKNRIRLEVKPELTSLDFANGVVHRGFIIPGVNQRRIETQIEMQSGGTDVAIERSGGTTDSASRGAELIEHAWLSSAAIGTCRSGLIPYTPCIPDPSLIQATRAIAEQSKEPKELIVMVTAELIDSIKPSSTPESAEKVNRVFAGPALVAIPSDPESFQAGVEMDVDQPHAPAILLTPLDKNCSDRPRVRLSEARVNTSPSPRILFGLGVNSDCGLAGNIAVHESQEVGSACRDNCCVKSDRCQPGDASCCRQTNHVLKIEDDECDDEDHEDEDDAVESFIAQVLQSQMQYLEGMMRARLHHESELLEVKAAAESALAKQKAEHVGEMMTLRLGHMTEIVALQEAIWDSERKAMTDRHRDALDHEREVAEMRAKHVEELQSQRIAALESEVKRLRGHAGASEPERVAQTPEDAARQSSMTRRPVLVELPIQVEELASGRVRYSPVQPKAGDQVTSTKLHDGLERVELITPPIATTRPTPTEIERLRREVARLHALIEDMVCVAPEAPPSPKPQSSGDDDDD